MIFMIFGICIVHISEKKNYQLGIRTYEEKIQKKKNQAYPKFNLKIFIKCMDWFERKKSEN